MRLRALFVVTLFGAVLAAPGVADAARVAVGLKRGADAAAVAAAVERRTGSRPERLGAIPALVTELPEGVSLGGIEGIRYVERLVSRRLAFTPTDPLVTRQWYLTQSRFYEPWLTLPSLERVPVAVIDSGVDATHPELAGKILGARSFVGGSPRVDALGHGTFVAGLIAAGVDNGIGIAGLAPSAELLVAKVVTPSRSIPIEAEAKAIRWAVENGARVINMSLGGIRDPLDPEPRQLLAARGRCGGVRRVERRGRRRGRRKPRSGAHEPVALRQLSRGAAPRPRGQRDVGGRRRPEVLEPRQGVQRHRSAGREDPLDLPSLADRSLSAVLRAGLLELWPRGLP